MGVNTIGLIPVSFLLSVVMSYISNEALGSSGTFLSFVVLFFFIALGILFDMIGVASTSATEKEFHSMAAHRVRGAREAVWMVRKRGKGFEYLQRCGRRYLWHRVRRDRRADRGEYHRGRECGRRCWSRF